MESLKRQFVLLLVAVLVPTAVTAQSLQVARTDLNTPAKIHIPARLPELVPARTHTDARHAAAGQTANTGKRHVMPLAIAIGIAGSIGAAGIAASRYGRNEGGSFCTRCFVQWSAISVPIGAGVGAAVGYIIDPTRR